MVAQATGLSIATWGNLLNELQELGELAWSLLPTLSGFVRNAGNISRICTCRS
ncbi:hypothetical protein GCM10010917_12530 [Paenibacillus physcomitrellae]|uniref:Uncharacterized protein n=1 Tax=Paenibacillus physcomitrellae TaxID=1619311 RepID=A0ABQ1FU35_9BACL|nr:hypothetical protein GCM10010917_12530 [Paenibacillus physcomitrellae]